MLKRLSRVDRLGSILSGVTVQPYFYLRPDSSPLFLFSREFQFPLSTRRGPRGPLGRTKFPMSQNTNIYFTTKDTPLPPVSLFTGTVGLFY